MTSFGRWIMTYLGIGEHEYEEDEEEVVYEDAPPNSYHARAIPSGSNRRVGAEAAYAETGAVRTLTREREETEVPHQPRTAVLRPVSPEKPAEAVVVAPSRFADAQRIGDRFKSSQPVVVNLKMADRDLTRRMIDFCSGAAYSLEGRMRKVADDVFLLEPRDVEVSSEQLRQLLEHGFAGA